MVADETGVILPPGVEVGREAPDRANVVIDNRTGLPDDQVQAAVETYFVEHSSLNGQQVGSFFTYANDGSLLARRQFQTPTSVRDEIKLARELADRDDDVGNAIGAALAVAFSEGFENYHPDDKATQVFNGLARFMGGSAVLKEMYREYLIAASVTTVGFPVRTVVPYRTPDDEQPGAQNQPVVGLMVGVLPAELIYPLGNDLFGDAELGYLPDDEPTRQWLREFFDPATSPGRRAEMRRADPVAATLFTGETTVENTENLLGSTMKVYRLNPRMAKRTSMPKGKAPHARPLLTRNFALLEAKRLLNIMDYALLQGGSNFIVVAKKGTDQRPAMPQEVANLTDVVRRASRTGVLVGDHRLSFEILTPNLDNLLNDSKRKLLGRKLAATVMRVPDQNTEQPGTAGMSAELEMLARVIASDRHDLKEHVEKHLWGEVVDRNPGLFDAPAKLWFPKIILQGSQFFTDFVLKLRDRGDIPRKFAVQAAGFDWEAGVAQRKRELESGDDEVMTPGAVPFSSPEMGPQDNNSGRPVGTSPDNGAPGATPGPGRDNVRPLRTINRNAGETVRAIFDDELGRTVRVGAQTYAILEQYPERELGRVTPLERDALSSGQPFTTGPLAIIPVNPGYEVAEPRAVRLGPGLSMLLGERRGDGALVAKALCFRAPEFDVLSAEETALRWGFPIAGWEEMEELARARPELPEPAPPAAAPSTTVILNAGGRRVRKSVIRDEHGNITAIEEEELPADDLDEYARAYSAEERRRGAREGWAMSDGSYPIRTPQDVSNAVRLWRSSNHDDAKVKAWIRKRAKAIGATDRLPDDWT